MQMFCGSEAFQLLQAIFMDKTNRSLYTLNVKGKGEEKESEKKKYNVNRNLKNIKIKAFHLVRSNLF